MSGASNAKCRRSRYDPILGLDSQVVDRGRTATLSISRCLTWASLKPDAIAGSAQRAWGDTSIARNLTPSLRTACAFRLCGMNRSWPRERDRTWPAPDGGRRQWYLRCGLCWSTCRRGPRRKPDSNPKGVIVTAKTNHYCDRLDQPVPRLEEFVGRRDIKLFDLMVVALLEHGAPLSSELLAARLTAAGVKSATGDMAYSLKKAWHGMEPVYRDADGRWGLNLSSSELKHRLFRLELRGARATPATTETEPTPEPIPDHAPLTEAELRWAFADRSLYNISSLRQAAAVLDAMDKPMDIAALNAYLSSLSRHRLAIKEQSQRDWEKGYVHRNAEGRLWLDRTATEVPAMRRAVRKLAAPGRAQVMHNGRLKRLAEERQVVLARERQQAQQTAAGLRRALLHVFPGTGPAAAAALLDIGSRTIETFIDDTLFKLPAKLEPFDVVAAYWVRESLQAVGVCDPDRFRLVDLKPPQKSRRLNRQGRTLTITPELLITSTTEMSHPLGDPAKMAAYLAAGDFAKLARRLESDVKALFAFYQYGVMHRCVRLRWGFLNDTLPVDWAVPGDPSLYEALQEYRGHKPAGANRLGVGAGLVGPLVTCPPREYRVL